MSDEQKKPEQIHRRDILKWGAMAGAAVAIGASGLGGLAPLVQTAAKPSKKDEKEEEQIVPFYGKFALEPVTRVHKHAVDSV